MKSNVLKFILAASLVLNVSVFTTAGYKHYMQTKMWVSPFGTVMQKDRFLFEQLSLMPGQLEAMKKKVIPFRAEIDRRRQDIAAKRKELVELMRSDKPDQKAIDRTIKEISSKQEEMQSMIAVHMLWIKEKLNKDQQQKFFDLVEQTMVEGGGHLSCPPSPNQM